MLNYQRVTTTFIKKKNTQHQYPRCNDWVFAILCVDLGCNLTNNVCDHQTGVVYWLLFADKFPIALIIGRDPRGICLTSNLQTTNWELIKINPL